MHHATKAALVKKYSELKAAGTTEADIREALKGEEKVEGKADVDAIIAAINEGTTGDEGDKPAKKGSHKVAPGKSFRDISNFDHEWKAGDDVSHFDAARLASLVEAGLVKTA